MIPRKPKLTRAQMLKQMKLLRQAIYQRNFEGLNMAESEQLRNIIFNPPRITYSRKQAQDEVKEANPWDKDFG